MNSGSIKSDLERALIHGRVSRQKVHVFTTLGIPDPDALGTGEDDGQRVIIVGAVFVFLVDHGGRGWGGHLLI